MGLINWKDIDEATGGSTAIPVVPAGPYPAIIESAEPRTTAGGKDSWKVKFKVTSGPNAGHVVWNDFTISPESEGAMKWFRAHMEAMGIPWSWLVENNPDGQQVADALVGRECVLILVIENWNNADRNKVKDVKKAGTAVAAAVAPTAPAFAPAPQPAGPAPLPAPGVPPVPGSGPQPQPNPFTPRGV